MQFSEEVQTNLHRTLVDAIQIDVQQGIQAVVSTNRDNHCARTNPRDQQNNLFASDDDNSELEDNPFAQDGDVPLHQFKN